MNAERSGAAGLHAVVGRCIGRTEDGLVQVQWKGGPGAAVPAWVSTQVRASELLPGSPVLLFVSEQSEERPVLTAVLSDGLQEGCGEEPCAETAPEQERRIEAADELELRCGEASLLLRSDGKVLLRGRDVTSRASRSNKIRGANVEIN